MGTPNPREEKGRQIARTAKIKKVGGRWSVPSQSSIAAAYLVDLVDETCTCKDHELRGRGSAKVRCKHQEAVLFQIAWSQTVDTDGTVTETLTVKRTQTPRNWPAYHESQVNEKAHVERLLSGLCDGIVQPPQAMGRPRNLLRDEVYALVHKVYTGMSGRRAQEDLKRCAERGYVTSALSYNSMFRAMEDPALTPILRTLIEEAALPLRDFESQFSPDSTGFSTITYGPRYFDHKHGKVKADHPFVKFHAFTGNLTNVIVNARVTDGADCPQLPGMLDEAVARGFQIEQVSADKGYLSKVNVKAIRAVGAQPFIPFKINSTGKGPAEWREMFAFFMLKQPEFLAHYHRRSNVESTFWMVKSKFGSSVRSKLPTAMANECYAKAVCHNLACLVTSMYESGLKPTFFQDGE